MVHDGHLNKSVLNQFCFSATAMSFRGRPGRGQTRTLILVMFLFIEAVNAWPMGYADDQFEDPMSDDTPAYFKGKKIASALPD